MSDTLNVFVSSTSKDLPKHREKVSEIIGLLRSPRCHAVIMEEFNAAPQNALEKCYGELRDADLFVGIYAYRYGWCPDESVTYVDKDGKTRCGDGKTSVTEWEYIWAKELGIPMLLFVADESDNYKWDDSVRDTGEALAALDAFKARVKTQVVGFFNLPDHLASRVGMAISEYIAQSRYTRADGWRILRAPEPPYYFAGRSKETSEILAGLAKSKTLIMTGIGGTGKTSLARHIGKEAQATYGGGILWLQLNPDIKQEKDAQLRAIAAWKEAHPNSRDSNAEISPNDLKRLLSERPAPLLAILDDAWSTDVITGIRACLPDGTPLLVTSRSASIATSKIGDYELYPLEHLSSDDAVIMLRSYFELDETHNAILKEIADLLGNHALALQLAAAWVKRDSPRNIVQEIPQLKAKLQAPKGLFRTLKMGDSRDENLEKALELSYAPLEEKLKSAFRLLSALPTGLDFTPELAFAVWDIADDEEARSDADENLRELMRIGLLERRSNGRYFLHQSLHAYASKLIEDNGEKERQEAAVERYYGKLTKLARGFETMPMQEWLSKLEEPYLQHFFQCADELLKVDIDSAAEEKLSDVLEFFVNVRRIALNRPQYHLLTWLEKGLVASQKLAQRSREALFLGELGRYYQDRGQLEKAVNYFEHALAIYREKNNRRDEGILLNNIGGIYKVRGELNKALETYQQALVIQQEVGNHSMEGATFNNIGAIYYARGELDKALDCYLKDLAITRGLGDRGGEGASLNNIALIYNARGELDKALEQYQQVLGIMREVGNRQNEGTSLNNIGMIYKARGESDKALEIYQQALVIRREVGDRRGESTSLNNIGMIYKAHGELDKALEYFQQALLIQHEVGDRHIEMGTLWNMGSLYYQQGELDKAISYAEEAVQLAREVQYSQLSQIEEGLAIMKRERDGG